MRDLQIPEAEISELTERLYSYIKTNGIPVDEALILETSDPLFKALSEDKGVNKPASITTELNKKIRRIQNRDEK